MLFNVYLCYQVAVDKKGALTDVGQQFVTPMNSKAKSEWDKEFVRWFPAIIHLYINLIAEYILIFPFYFRWIAKSARPLSMGETDKAFRAFIKKITFGRYVPPCAATVNSELVNLFAETQAQMKNEMTNYLKQGLYPCITTDAWGEDGEVLFCVCIVVAMLLNICILCCCFC